MSTVFRIRIQDQQSPTVWKIHLEFHQDEALREKRGLFQFKPEDFSALQGLSVKEYGTYLGKALFQDYELRDFFSSAFHNSEQLMKVALSVEVDESPESHKLKTLHWERLCVPIEQNWEYLALHQRLPFAHHVSTGNLRRYSLIQKEDLRALIVIANPDSLKAEYDLAPIDVDTTVAKIQAALGDIPCDILANHSDNALGLPTLKQIREQLSIAEPPYTILHIVSHGRVDSKGETTLYWSDENHQVEPIKDKYLIGQLRLCEHLPHLIFLCCCSSASFFQGLAQKLIEQLGTPAVIAMTDKVSINTGIALTENFYPRLRESGNVDIALKRAAAPLAERYDITVPALFSYRINSALFGIQVNITGGSDYAIQVFAQAAYGNSTLNCSQNKITEPYKFLSYYNTYDADIFFGREAITEQLVAKIISHKIVLINGKSGSGKTSLINAGIIPGLMEKGYFTLVFRDYRYPTESIQAGLSQLEQVNINLKDCQTLLECIQATIKQTGQPIVIVLDQFERFFLNLPEAQWRQFAQELKDCLNASDSQQMNIVISLRVDFYGQLGEFWDDIPEINTESYQQYLKPLNITEATAAIEKPLEKMEENIEYDPDFLTQCLVPNLLQPTQGLSQEKVEPVHLQIVCNQLFEEVRSRYSEELKAGKWVTIKQDLYDELGGVEGILQGYVEVILNRHYSPDQQEIVKSILKQMVSSQGTRVYQSIADMADHLNLAELLVVLEGHQHEVNSARFSPDGNRIITASADGTAKIWDLNGKLLTTLSGHQYWVITAEFSRDGETIITASDDKTATIWNTEGEQLLTLKGHQDAVNSAQFSPDGNLIVTASLDDNTARIWNIKGELLTTLWHSSAVWKANFSPDGGTVVTAAEDGNARVWSLKGELLTTLPHDDLVNSASFSPDGNAIVTASQDGRAKVWSFPPLSELIQQACDRVGNYLKYAPDVAESDRHLCDRVAQPQGP